MKHHITEIISGILVSLLLVTSVNAQDSSIRPAFDLKYNPFQVEFSQGVGWLYNSDKNSFYFVVYSDHVSATNLQDVFLVDNKIFRVFLFNPEDPVPPGDLDSTTVDGIMRVYISGRMEHFAQSQEVGEASIKMRPLTKSRWIAEWLFQTRNDPGILGHVFLSTIVHDRILTLNRVIRDGDDLNQAKIWLRRVANTLIEKENPMGPKALGAILRGED